MRIANWLYIKRSALRLLAALPIAWLVSTVNLDGIEGKLFNALYETKCAVACAKPDLPIEIVYVSKETMKSFGDSRLLTPQVWVQFAEQIAKAGPKTLAFVGLNPHVLPTDADKRAFVTALAPVPKLLMGSDYDTTQARVIPLNPILAERFTVGDQWVTSDQQSFARDFVTRRAFLQIDRKPGISTLVAESFIGPIDPAKARGVFEVAGSAGNYQYYINYTRVGRSFGQRDFLDVLSGRNLESLRGKTVIVGFLDPTTEIDFWKTPFRAEGAQLEIPTAELIAQQAATLIAKDPLVKLRPGYATALLIVAVLVTSFGAFSLTPGMGLLLSVSVIAATLLFAFLLFLAGFWLPAMPPLVGTIVAYYVLLPFRLIGEHNRRWELQKRHQLLLEVEELKSNFMSLVSHDLKTPVARIQGLAELGLDDPKIAEMPRQKQLLEGVLKSSQELLQFIGNILSLSRIESGTMQLSLQPTDPNELIGNSVEKLCHLASSKGIRVQTDLEPLFSIRCDAALIGQVIHNLIENAILYSGGGSAVQIASREVSEDGAQPFVRVSVRDHGIGIDESDMGRIFKKFYRGRHPNKIATKGSGLGLYLVKYFTELHGGRVSVESKVGDGSTFIIELPVSGPAQTQKEPAAWKRAVRSIFRRESDNVAHSGG